jgi:hypothetical protein
MAAGGTRGISRAAYIHDLKVIPCNGGGNNWMFVNAVNHAVSAGLPRSVINASISFYLPFSSGSVNQAVNNAVDAGVVFVTSSGNYPQYDSCSISPNSASKSLTVGASAINDTHASFSTPGACTELAAPGVNVNGARLGGAYGATSGTSFSSPLTAGVAASIWMENPGLTAAQVRQEVIDSATPNILSGVPIGTPNRLLQDKPGAQSANQPPNAVASINWSYVYSGRPGVQINAGASSDPDNHTPLTYTWNETNHAFVPTVMTPVMTPNMTSPTVTFTAPINSTAVSKTYYFNLDVKDSLGLQSVGSSGVSMVVVPDACTVYDQSRFLSELPFAQIGNAAADYTLSADTSLLETTLTNYITNAQSLNSQVTGATLILNLRDYGTSGTPSVSGSSVANAGLQSVSKNNGVFNAPAGGFWTGTPLEVDRWYRLHSNLRPVHNGGGMNNDCTDYVMYFRLPTYTGGGTTRPVDIFDPQTNGTTQVNIDIKGAQTTNGFDDMAVWRPSNGTWYMRKSSGGFNTINQYQWGTQGDIPLARTDMTGDGLADLVVWRPSARTWYTKRSPNFNSYFTRVVGSTADDQPIPRTDLNGDGTDDMVTWNPNTGVWSIRMSPTFNTVVNQTWGVTGDIPMPGTDLNGDGNDDLVVWRPSNGTWYARFGPSFTQTRTRQWGSGALNDMPFAGSDFNGDNSSDPAVLRPGDPTVFVQPSTSNIFTSPINRGLGVTTGTSHIIPNSDFDGDGRADMAVWHENTGMWYIRGSASGFNTVTQVQWGTLGDVPFASADFNGDGRTDIGVFRAAATNGTFFVRMNTGTGTNISFGAPVNRNLGRQGDIVVVGPFDTP